MVPKLLEYKSSRTGEGQLKASARVYLAAVESGKLRESLKSLNAPLILWSKQIFIECSVPYLYAVHRFSSSFEVTHNLRVMASYRGDERLLTFWMWMECLLRHMVL